YGIRLPAQRLAGCHPRRVAAGRRWWLLVGPPGDDPGHRTAGDADLVADVLVAPAVPDQSDHAVDQLLGMLGAAAHTSAANSPASPATCGQARRGHAPAAGNVRSPNWQSPIA